MRGLQKSRRVSWASDVNLCQVRLFLSDESPSQVGSETQDHLQAKSSWISQPTGAGFDDNLPPGFEGANPTDLLKNKLSQISLTKWICPPRFVLDFAWQVVAGEECKEVEIQNQREMRVLEAVYPRPSAIPPNPSETMGIEDRTHNDLNIPLIPITPIEDEDTTAGGTLTYPVEQHTIPTSSHSTYCTTPTANGNTDVGVVPGVEPDMVAQAAYAVLNAVATSNNQGSMIDPDLLMKILNDPKWHERLIANQRGSTNPDSVSYPIAPGVLSSEPSLVQTSRADIGAPSSTAPPLNVPFYSPNIVRPNSPPPVPKDLNYYKSLIQQHGGDRQDTFSHLNTRQNPQLGLNQEPAHNPKSRDSKPKKTKPCIYFNSSRGCRNGANCPYQHDASSQPRSSGMNEVQSAKRVKLDREITGE